MQRTRRACLLPDIALVLPAVIAVVLIAASACTGADPPPPVAIGVDTSGIDARTDLTNDEKAAVKTAMQNTIKENLDQAFGAGNTTVNMGSTTGADRTVTCSNTHPVYRDRNNEYYRPWGQRDPGSANGTVFVGRVMDVHGASFKNPDGSWNTDALGTAMGHVAAHEIAHTYCAGHVRGKKNKMSSSQSTTSLKGTLNLPESTRKHLRENRGKPPCLGAAYYSVGCTAHFGDNPGFVTGDLPTDPYAIDTTFVFSGPLASMFDFGWWGIDTDDGALDGNPWGDFVYKSGMLDPDPDAENADLITFFDGYAAQFVLQGLPGTPYDGQLLTVSPENVVLSDPVTWPDGTVVDRQINLSWDVDGDAAPDVSVEMSTLAYGADSPTYSGFTFGIPEPPSIGECKQMCDGTYVEATGVVTARFEDGFYIESPDHSSGIFVNWPAPIPPDQPTAKATGDLGTGPTGERQINAVSVKDAGPGTVSPLGMPNRSVGGSAFHYFGGNWPAGQQGVLDGIGPNNIGLLVRVWGKFYMVDNYTFLVDDGSNRSIKCVVPPGVNLDPTSEYVAVTGISSCEAVSGGLSPVVRVRQQSDLTAFL